MAVQPPLTIRTSAACPRPRSYGEEAEVRGDSIVTGFAIPRKATIASDNIAHKVIIADIALAARILHYTAPVTKDNAVYLQSKAKNTSNYVMLASPKVSIFVDGTFVSTSKINQNMPGENLNLYIGADPHVKCEYKAVADKTASGGWLGGSKVKDQTFKTILTNTKSKPCRLLLADVLPKSSLDKIVVELTCPAPKSLRKVRLHCSRGRCLPVSAAPPVAARSDLGACLRCSACFTRRTHAAQL
jgi:uncharacterized protein (TIGR02231 family)